MPEMKIPPLLEERHRAYVAAQQRKRYSRTRGELLLFRWVLLWMLLAALATGVMLYFLIQISQMPVVNERTRKLLDIHRMLTTETYHANDDIDVWLRGRITKEKIKDFMK